MQIQIKLILLVIFMPLLITCGNKGNSDVYSPDGKVHVNFILEEGAAYYSVAYNGKIVIKPSALGFLFKSAEPMTHDFAIIETSKKSVDETWQPVWGECREIRNNYQELLVKLKQQSAPHRVMHLVFRAYDDGIGFRYILPEQPDLKNVEIMSENTEFRFSGDHSAWWIKADYDSYEQLYKNTPLSEIKAVNTPITMETADSLCLSIHEANLTNYAGMTLNAIDAGKFAFECDLVPWPDGVKVKASTPLRTPWRTIQIATEPGGLIESQLIVNLNEPCVIEDPSWIKPMKYMGIWWGMHIGKETWYMGPKHGATTENAKRYIDFAGKHGIPALLIEGWNPEWKNWGKAGAFNFTTAYPDFDLEEVVRYGRKKGVVIIGHHESGGDVPTYEKQIDAGFALYEKLGVPAVKTGYAGKIRPEGQHHHGQWMVEHYRMVVKKAAQHHITLDAHEPIKPTGIRRTYPNMMTREGVRGMEYNAWSEGNPPEHTTILPFTRMLAGPLDYTPGIFDLTFNQYRKDNRVHSTLANQLALYVVLFSPLQMAADLPENYENQPAFDFIKAVPVNWDETRVLNAKIGDFVTIARKHGNDWYLGSITDEHARKLEVPLTFLDSDKKYTAHIYADGPGADWESNPTAIGITKYIVDHSSILSIALAPGGGQAIRFTPLPSGGSVK